MKRFAVSVVTLLVLFSVACPAFAKTIYVAKTGSDDTGDGSAGKPYLTITKAYTSGVTADGSDIIRVSPGVYDESLVLFWWFPVTITSENPDDPAVVASTIIDGGGRPVSAIRFQAGSGDGTTITGFTIRHGHATLGSGIRISHGSPTITKNVITNNIGNPDEGASQGAGIWIDGVCTPTIDGNTITNNCSDYGAGIMVGASTGATITNNVISNNTAALYAGGIWVSYTPVTISGNTISDNVCNSLFGGGIMMYQTYGTPSVVTNNRFLRNRSVRSGGAIYIEDHKVSEISGNTFEGNSASQGDGTAVYVYRGTAMTMTNNAFCGNYGTSSAAYAALAANMCPGITLSHCTFYGNRTSGSQGAAIGFYNGNITVTNCIFKGNVVPFGAAHAVFGSGSTATISYCDIEGGEAQVAHYLGTYTWGSGNFDADPLFAAPGTLNTNGTPDDWTDDVWTPGDYHLKSSEGRWDPAANAGAGGWVNDPVSSPCIDAGDPASGFSLEPQPNGSRANVGAYGDTVQASRSPGCNVTMAVTPAGAGTTDPGEGLRRLTLNRPTTLTATPTPPMVFDRWTATPSGDAAFDDQYAATTAMTPSGNATITAVFAANVAAPVFSVP